MSNPTNDSSISIFLCTQIYMLNLLRFLQCPEEVGELCKHYLCHVILDSFSEQGMQFVKLYMQ